MSIYLLLGPQLKEQQNNPTPTYLIKKECKLEVKRTHLSFPTGIKLEPDQYGCTQN